MILAPGLNIIPIPKGCHDKTNIYDTPSGLVISSLFLQSFHSFGVAVDKQIK
jgi:hypothetical protein